MREGWEFKKLGELATFVNGYPFKPSDWKKEGRKIIRIQNLNNPDAEYNYYDGEIDLKYVVVSGDVLISWSGSLGVFEWSQEESILNQHIFKVVFNKGEISKRYFEYVVSSRLNEMKSKVHGITMQHITKKDFDVILIPLPPLSEQERIVAELDLLSSIIEKKKAQLKEYDQLAQSIFYDMFGDPVTNEKGWEQQPFHSICKSLFAGGDVPKDNYSKTKTEKYNVPIISNGINDKAIYGYTNIAKVEEESLTISGRGTIGYCAIRKEPFFPVIRLIVATPKQDLVLPIALKYIIDSLNLKGEGVAIPQLTIPKVKNESIILPPLSLQQQFASKIEAIEHQKTLIQQSITEVETLFNSRMDYWFN